MRHIFRYLFVGCVLTLFIVQPVRGQVFLPYDADSVTQKQKTSNPSRLAYPTWMQGQIEQEVSKNCGNTGVFSVSPTKKVVFSPGNLQYNAALGSHQCADGTTQPGTWRFAEHQWDVIGIGYGMTDEINFGGTVVNGGNSFVSDKYNGWIDLFGWGTSGWNSGANAYRPYSTSMSPEDYYPGGSLSSNLTGQYVNADWGVYNQIGSDSPGTWRTLTNDEWVYLFERRSTESGIRFAGAMVNGLSGIILLPNDWSMSYYTLISTNNYDQGVLVNNISVSDWKDYFEEYGAIFLPASGYRYSTSLYYTGTRGVYWSSTAGSDDCAYGLYFKPEFGVNAKYLCSRFGAFCVRLVSDI